MRFQNLHNQFQGNSACAIDVKNMASMPSYDGVMILVTRSYSPHADCNDMSDHTRVVERTST